MKTVIKIIMFVVIGILVGFILNKSCKPTLSNEFENKLKNQNMNDSIMYDYRHIGDISLDKFIAFALKAHSSDFDTTCIKRDKDSILFIVKQTQMFYGEDEGEWWREKYKNLPIRIFDDNSFKAKIIVINDKEYIHIPYHILSCLVDFVHKKDNSQSTEKVVQKDRDGRDITIRSEKDLQNVEENGSKIQTEGIVFKNVSDIITMSGYQGGDKYKQIEILWKYARSRWTYINDPAGTTDTWRSASETIENYYFTSERRYTGDCDDFAILMASFARQVGLDSRFVVTMGSEGGHAYAEFYRETDGRWVNMDWNSEHLGGTPYGKRIKVYDNL